MTLNPARSAALRSLIGRTVDLHGSTVLGHVESEPDADEATPTDSASVGRTGRFGTAKRTDRLGTIWCRHPVTGKLELREQDWTLDEWFELRQADNAEAGASYRPRQRRWNPAEECAPS